VGALPVLILALFQWFMIALFAIGSRVLALGRTEWERRIYATAVFSLLLCVIAQVPLLLEQAHFLLMSSAEQEEFVVRNGAPIEALFWVQVSFTTPVVIGSARARNCA
jgi:hypothetical protein